MIKKYSFLFLLNFILLGQISARSHSSPQDFEYVRGPSLSSDPEFETDPFYQKFRNLFRGTPASEETPAPSDRPPTPNTPAPSSTPPEAAPTTRSDMSSNSWTTKLVAFLSANPTASVADFVKAAHERLRKSSRNPPTLENISENFKRLLASENPDVNQLAIGANQKTSVQEFLGGSQSTAFASAATAATPPASPAPATAAPPARPQASPPARPHSGAAGADLAELKSKKKDLDELQLKLMKTQKDIEELIRRIEQGQGQPENQITHAI